MAGGVFIAGVHVDLVALTEEHALTSEWYSWFNDEKLTEHMQKHYYPNTAQMQLEYYRNEVAGRRDRLQLGIVPHGEDRLIGVISLNSIDAVNRKAEISMLAGVPEARRLESTLEAMRLLIAHAFYTLNLRRIYGGTIAREWATLLCRTLGFREEGTMREDVYKQGAYRDVYFVAVLEPDFAQAAGR